MTHTIGQLIGYFWLGLIIIAPAAYFIGVIGQYTSLYKIFTFKVPAAIPVEKLKTNKPKKNIQKKMQSTKPVVSSYSEQYKLPELPFN